MVFFYKIKKHVAFPILQLLLIICHFGPHPLPISVDYGQALGEVDFNCDKAKTLQVLIGKFIHPGAISTWVQCSTKL